MAKQQTFEDKAKKFRKGAGEFKVVKIIYSVRSSKTGAWRFPDKLVKVPSSANEEQFLAAESARLAKEFGK